MDGWSIEILIKEVWQIYQAKIKGEKIITEKPPFQFKDYVSWYLEKQEKEARTNAVFWKTYLQNYYWKKIVRRDSESQQASNKGNTIRKVFSTLDMEKLYQFLSQQQISLHTFLVATYNFIIHKIYAHTDICIGTLSAGRTSTALEKQLGMFAKTLPLRTKINPDKSIAEILRHIHQGILEINIHQDIPHAVLNELRLETLFVLQNASTTYQQIKIGDEVSLEQYPLDISYSRIPLLLNARIEDETLKIDVDYNPTYYERSTIEILLLKYEKMLFQIIHDPNQTLQQTDIDLEIEKEQKIIINFDF